MNKILETFGFVLELSFFISSGYYLGTGNFLASTYFLIIAFVIAFLVGEQIKQNAIEEYRNDIKESN